MDYYTLPPGKELNTLEACVVIEECCARIYRHFAELYGSAAEGNDVWTELANDEDEHAEKFRAALLRHGKDPACQLTENYLIVAMIDNLNALLQKIRRQPPQLKEAYLTAAVLEHSLEKYHVETGKLLVNRELVDLLSSMAHNDRCHREMMQQMA